MRILLLMICFGLLGCVAGITPAINMDEIDADVQKALQLYPATTDYRVLIVPDAEAVEAEHIRIYGVECNRPAFYSIREDLIVVPRDCTLQMIYHEAGHAVVEAYFKAPVPRWLHERLAQRAEGKASR